MNRRNGDERGSRVRSGGGVNPRPEVPVPGVSGVEHTADLGLEVEAPTLPELFRRGALGAMWLVLERDAVWRGPAGPPEERAWDPPLEEGARDGPARVGDPAPSVQEHRTLELVDEEISSLFRSWLRALLYWEETEGFVSRTVAISFAPIPLCSAPDGQAFGLTARVGGVVDTGPRVREIKGVTLHGLFVERAGEGWRGRVIFDV
jgi:SHS2 domain-containing protein